jgi:succinoglycan biosynthesis transport protein ExoP
LVVSDLREGTEQRGTLEDFLRVVHRRGWVVLCTFGVTLVVILFLILTGATVYQSYSQLLVNRGQSMNAFSPNVRTLSWEEELSSELETIQSARIYERAQEIIDEQQITTSDGQPYKIKPRNIDATTPGKSSIIYLYYRDYDPVATQAVVRAMTQAYKEFRTDERRMDPSDFLQQEIDQLSDEIGEWERRRAEFLVQEGSVEIKEERSSLLDTRRNIDTQLATIRADVAERKARLDWMRDLLASLGSDDDVSAEMYVFGEADQRSDLAMSTLRRTILDTKSEYYDARSKYTENHPRVLALRDRIRELNDELRQEADGYTRHLDALYQAALAQETSLEASLTYVNEQLSAFPDREAQLAALDRTINTLRSNHEALVRRRLDALTTRVGSTPWDVVVLQEAVEATPLRTRDYVRMTVIAVFSLVLGLGLAFLLDNLDHSLKDRAEAELHLKVPVLAAVSRIRK